MATLLLYWNVWGHWELIRLLINSYLPGSQSQVTEYQAMFLLLRDQGMRETTTYRHLWVCLFILCVVFSKCPFPCKSPPPNFASWVSAHFRASAHPPILPIGWVPISVQVPIPQFYQFYGLIGPLCSHPVSSIDPWGSRWLTATLQSDWTCHD